MGITTILHDAGLAGFVSVVLSAALVGINQLDEYQWGRRWATRRSQRNRRLAILKEFYERRPKRPLYDLVSEIALARTVRARSERFQLRARRLDTATDEMQALADRLACEWISTVGEFARRVAQERLPLRPFLATYHLTVIREGAVAIPISLRLLVAGRLSWEDRERLYWGMALLDLAGDYNSIARQQRQAIYYEEREHNPPVGPVRNAPAAWAGPFLTMRDLSSPKFILRRWRYQRSRHWLKRLATEMKSPKQAA